MKAVKLLSVFLILSAGVCGAVERDEEDLERRLRVSDPTIGNPLLGNWRDWGTKAGFEIGNGRKLIKNLPGQYLLKIYDKWEVGQVGSFTEIISPMSEGIPRARMQISVNADTQVQTVEDLIRNRRDETWIPVVLGKLQGVQQDTVLPSGLHEIEARLYRNPGEVIILRMDGRPGRETLTAFDKAQQALTTFQTSLQ